MSSSRYRARRSAAAALGVLVLAAAPAAATMADPPPGLAVGHLTQVVWSQWSDDGGSMRVMTSYGDGSDAHPVTAFVPGQWDTDPHLSPNGRTVLFERLFPDDFANTVMTVAIDGTGEHAIDVGCHQGCLKTDSPTWGPGGHSIWFTKVLGDLDQPDTTWTSALWSADSSGKHLRRESPASIDGTYEEYSAMFLPSGERVNRMYWPAVVRSTVIKTDRDGTRHQLTDWSVDADLAHVSPVTTGPTAGLVVFETLGSGGRPPGVAQQVATVPSSCGSVEACAPLVRYLTPHEQDPLTGAQSYNASWSPDGSRIVFVRETSTGADVWTMTPDGQDQRPLVTDPRWDFRPEWGRSAP